MQNLQVIFVIILVLLPIGIYYATLIDETKNQNNDDIEFP